MGWESGVASAGLVVSVASLAASLLNQYVRNAQESGANVQAWVLHASAALNAVALNGDKCVQALRLARGGK